MPCDDREIVLGESESRENPTRGPGRSGCVAITPTRMKGLFCVAWLWPGQAGGVCLLRGFRVFGFGAGGPFFLCFCLAKFFGAGCLCAVVTGSAARLWGESA